MKKDCTSIVIRTVTRPKSGHTTKRAKKSRSHVTFDAHQVIPAFVATAIKTAVIVCRVTCTNSCLWHRARAVMLADEWNTGQVALVNTQFKRLCRIRLSIRYKKRIQGISRTRRHNSHRQLHLFMQWGTSINLTLLIHTNKNLSDNSLWFGCGNTILRACGDVQWDCFASEFAKLGNTHKKQFLLVI